MKRMWSAAGVVLAWAANPEAAPVNGAGLPASPFRTDDGNVPSLGNDAP